MTKGPPV